MKCLYRLEVRQCVDMALFTSFELAATVSNIFLAAAILLSALFVLDYRLRHGHRYPPGPKPLPFIGNLHQIPKGQPWVKFKEWSEEYGPIYTLWMGRKPTMVIGNAEVANDLLERKSLIYSSRPHFPVMGDLYIRNEAALTMPYGEKWRTHRKLMHSGLMQKAAISYRPIQEWESRRLAYALFTDPEHHMPHFERYATSVVMCIAYGRRVDTSEDPVVRQILNCMHYMGSLNVPGAFLANTFPILTKLPDVLAPWKVEVKAKGYERENVLMDQAREVKRKMDAGTAAPCFTQQLWEIRDEYNLPDSQFANVTGAVFAAGSDTTSSSLSCFLLAATAFPEVMNKGREELDRVVGDNRSPTWSDEAQLPYIQAIVKEIFRWRPVAVLGGQPHASTQEDVYNGYYIPKGSTMLANLWAIQLNEHNFPDPHNFIPERHLTERLNYPHTDGHSAFGFGRRKCVGEHVAKQSLFINVARILWAFDIKKASDPLGREIDVDIFKFAGGFNIRPQDFKCSIEVRSKQRAEVLKRDMKEAEMELEKYAV